MFIILKNRSKICVVYITIANFHVYMKIYKRTNTRVQYIILLYRKILNIEYKDYDLFYTYVRFICDLFEVSIFLRGMICF